MVNGYIISILNLLCTYKLFFLPFQMIPQAVAPLLPVPTPIQPTNTPVFPTPGLQPSLAPMTDISVNTTPDEANAVDNRTELLNVPENNSAIHLDKQNQTSFTDLSVQAKEYEKTKIPEGKKQDQLPAKPEEVVQFRKISRFQVSVVKEDPAAHGKFHS